MDADTVLDSSRAAGGAAFIGAGGSDEEELPCFGTPGAPEDFTAVGLCRLGGGCCSDAVPLGTGRFPGGSEGGAPR